MSLFHDMASHTSSCTDVSGLGITIICTYNRYVCVRPDRGVLHRFPFHQQAASMENVLFAHSNIVQEDDRQVKTRLLILDWLL